MNDLSIVTTNFDSSDKCTMQIELNNQTIPNVFHYLTIAWSNISEFQIRCLYFSFSFSTFFDFFLSTPILSIRTLLSIQKPNSPCSGSKTKKKQF